MVPPWPVQPVSIVPSTHYASHSPRLSQRVHRAGPSPTLCFFSPSFALAACRRSPRAPPVSVLPASRASNKIPICQLGGGRAPDAHLSRYLDGHIPLLFFSLSPFPRWHLPALAMRNHEALHSCRVKVHAPSFYLYTRSRMSLSSSIICCKEIRSLNDIDIPNIRTYESHM